MSTIVPTLFAALWAGCAPEGQEGLPVDPYLYEHQLIQLDLVRDPLSRDPAPLAGATVAIDDAAGQRALLTSDEAGHVEMLVEWSRGPYAVTIDAGMAGQPLVSLLGVEAPDRHLTWTFTEGMDPADTVQVSGVVEGHDPYDQLRVMAYGAGSDSWATWSRLGLYTLSVLPDQPFNLLAVDMVESYTPDVGLLRQVDHWRMVDEDGVSEATRIDLVDADAVESTLTSGTFRLPSAQDDPLRAGGRGDLVVTCTVDGRAQECGWATWVNADRDHNRIAFFARHVVPGETERLQTRIEAVRGQNGSRMWVNGDPGAWTEVPELMAVPQVEDTATATTDMTGWTVTAAPVDPDLVARWWATWEAEDGEVLWLVRGTDDRLVELPAPPPTVDVAALLGEVHAVRTWLKVGEGEELVAESWSEPARVRQP